MDPNLTLLIDSLVQAGLLAIGSLFVYFISVHFI